MDHFQYLSTKNEHIKKIVPQQWQVHKNGPPKTSVTPVFQGFSGFAGGPGVLRKGPRAPWAPTGGEPDIVIVMGSRG